MRGIVQAYQFPALPAHNNTNMTPNTYSGKCKDHSSIGMVRIMTTSDPSKVIVNVARWENLLGNLPI